MPLQPGNSQETIGKNVATEINAGRPRDQAIAIAENTARKGVGVKKKAGRVGVKKPG